jgi:hypothetical protein
MRHGSRLEIVISLITLLAISWTLTSGAATAYVGVSYFGLSPATVNIEEGDVVYWHDEDEDFAPYLISGDWGAFYTPNGILFNVPPGTYSYTAQSLYGGGSWGGSVVVSSGVPNSPPVVTITSPTNNSVLTAPATFTFAADASDADPGDLWDVEFWVGDDMVDDVYDPPYTTTVTNLPAGIHTLKVVAWDYSYATATNTISITIVEPGPITLTGSALAGGNFRFEASGLVVGKTNVLQSSTNLTSPLSWVSISTNVAAGSMASFTNTLSVGPHFFRVIQWP